MVRAYTTGNGSGELSVWNVLPMMSRIMALMTTEEETVPMSKMFSYLCNQLLNGFFVYFLTILDLVILFIKLTND